MPALPCLRISEKIFWMYEGPEERLTIRCRHHMMENIIDYFGGDVVPENVTTDTFDVKVDVSVSKTFFAWVLGCAGDITIAGPEKVKKEYILVVNICIRTSMIALRL